PRYDQPSCSVQYGCEQTVNSVYSYHDTATTDIYTLSLHDALPIYVIRNAAIGTIGISQGAKEEAFLSKFLQSEDPQTRYTAASTDRKSTRLNSSHDQISYAVFCLKKKRLDRKRLVHHTR